MSKVLKMGVAVLGSTGLVVAVAENYHHFSVSLEENYWTVLAIAWIFSITGIWPQPERKRILGLGPRATNRTSRFSKGLRYKWVFLITAVFLAAVCYRYYIVSTPNPGKRPAVSPGEIPLPAGSYSRIAFEQSGPKAPRLIQFSLIPEKTLYVYVPPNTYKLPYGVINHIYSGQCVEDFDAGASLQALRNLARNKGKEDLLKYIPNEQKLRQLVKDHPSEAKELLPSKSEWQKLDRLEYNSILGWVKNCVGIFFPVFLVTIENPTDQAILISTMTSRVHGIQTSKGEGKAGPLIPTSSYTHKINIHKGSQELPLTPGFNIPAKQNGSFEIQLWTDRIETSVDLDMDITFSTSKGSVKTNRFHLVFDVVPE